MSVAIVDYGLGNLASVQCTLGELGADPYLAGTPQALNGASHIVLPGVGSFSEGMRRLHAGAWVPALERVVHEHKQPLLGICLGMQLLATSGHEGGDCAGLGFIEGEVRHFGELGCALRVPHIGWNEVSHDGSDPLFARIPDQMDFYFVHSFVLCPAHRDDVLGMTDYGIPVAAVVRRKGVIGAQFHPEKSSWVGRQLLRNFLELGRC